MAGWRQPPASLVAFFFPPETVAEISYGSGRDDAALPLFHRGLGRGPAQWGTFQSATLLNFTQAAGFPTLSNSGNVSTYGISPCLKFSPDFQQSSRNACWNAEYKKPNLFESTLSGTGCRLHGLCSRDVQCCYAICFVTESAVNETKAASVRPGPVTQCLIRLTLVLSIYGEKSIKFRVWNA